MMKKRQEEARQKDSDDEEGPQQTMVKSAVTPGGSQWGDGSNAGRSIMSASKKGDATGKSSN